VHDRILARANPGDQTTDKRRAPRQRPYIDVLVQGVRTIAHSAEAV
jgi:hypothetical protein